MRKVFFFFILSFSFLGLRNAWSNPCFVGQSQDSFSQVQPTYNQNYPLVNRANQLSFRQYIDNYNLVNGACPAIDSAAGVDGLDDLLFNKAIYFKTLRTHPGGGVDMSDNEIIMTGPIFFKNTNHNLVIGNWTTDGLGDYLKFKDKNDVLHYTYTRTYRRSIVRILGAQGLDNDPEGMGRVTIRFDIGDRISDGLRDSLPQKNGSVLPFICQGYQVDENGNRDPVLRSPSKHVIFRNVTIVTNGFDKEDLFGSTDREDFYIRPNFWQAGCLVDGGGVTVINEAQADEGNDPVEEPGNGGGFIPLPGGGLPIPGDGGVIPMPENNDFPIPGDDPVVPEEPAPAPADCPPGVRSRIYFLDRDGDGYTLRDSDRNFCEGDELNHYITTTNGFDCNDNDPTIGVSVLWKRDQDGDRFYPRMEEAIRQCPQPNGEGWHHLHELLENSDEEYFLNAPGIVDCDDTDPEKTPFSGCDGDIVDENALDLDDDGQCGIFAAVCVCDEVDPLNCPTPGDCNTEDDKIYTGAEVEEDFCAQAFADPARDANCDGEPDVSHSKCRAIDGLDSDGDGYCSDSENCCPEGEDSCEFTNDAGISIVILGHNDCDDSNVDLSPNRVEEGLLCSNQLDDDCDGSSDAADEGCAGAGGVGGVAPLPGLSPEDIDNDGDGYTENAGDCNDANADVHPRALEICANGRDDNCNDSEDENCNGQPDYDNDGDGFCEGVRIGLSPTLHCNAEQIAPDGGPVRPGDCDDNNVAVHPNALEDACDGIDNNCDGLIDSQFVGLSAADSGVNRCVTGGGSDFFGPQTSGTGSSRPSRATGSSVACSLNVTPFSVNAVSLGIIVMSLYGLFISLRKRLK